MITVTVWCILLTYTVAELTNIENTFISTMDGRSLKAQKSGRKAIKK